MVQMLDPSDPLSPFPPVDAAETEPDGLLAIGGDLSIPRLIRAYRRGIFPWYSQGQPILWWSPNPRTVLYPDRLRVRRSLAKTLRNRNYRITLDRCFRDVIWGCAQPRPGQPETWITREMLQAYCRLHEAGYAHSVEYWENDELCGGLYGVTLGQVFFGESMFSLRRDASKIAMVWLCARLQQWNYRLIDCQVRSSHLLSLGAEEIPRREFTRLLDEYCESPPRTAAWQTRGDDSNLLVGAGSVE